MGAIPAVAVPNGVVRAAPPGCTGVVLAIRVETALANGVPNAATRRAHNGSWGVIGGWTARGSVFPRARPLTRSWARGTLE